MKKILIITDSDLDGAGSAIFLKQYHKDCKVEIIEIVQDKYFDQIVRDIKVDKYDIVYVTDLQIQEASIDKFDQNNVVIVDHHMTHYDVRDRYKNAKVLLQPHTSTANLLMTIMGDEHLSEKQTELMKYIDDYDQYALEYSESLELQAIFSQYNKPRVAKFIESFGEGFREYTSFEKNAVSIYNRKLNKAKEETEFFKGKVGNYVWVSFTCTDSPNELADYAIKKYKADICLVIYPQFESVSFRKSKNCTAQLHKIAEVLCEGGGHEYAAGGKLNDAIVKLTNKLLLC